VLGRLWHHTFVRRKYQQSEVYSGRARHHVSDKVLVSRYVDNAGRQPTSQIQNRETKIDGDTAPLLLFPTISVNTRKSLHQRGLTVIDMPCGANYDVSFHGNVSQNVSALSCWSSLMCR
jgi:hypothetical protein